MSIYDLKSNPNNESRRRGPSPTYEFHMPAMPPLNLLHSARRLLRASSQRRRLRRLLELDDHMLEDMGYCRYELRWALRLPLKADAFTALQRCRAGRE